MEGQMDPCTDIQKDPWMERQTYKAYDRDAGCFYKEWIYLNQNGRLSWAQMGVPKSNPQLWMKTTIATTNTTTTTTPTTTFSDNKHKTLRQLKRYYHFLSNFCAISVPFLCHVFLPSSPYCCPNLPQQYHTSFILNPNFLKNVPEVLPNSNKAK